MDQVIMPELITPKFAEVLAENPEVLKMIVDHQPNEEVIVGQNCTLESSCNPANVKLVFCNVTIGMEEKESEFNKGCGTGEEDQVGSIHIKIGDRDFKKDGMKWIRLSNELRQLELEIAVLEARRNEAEKMLRMIPRQACNRKLVARCKLDMNDALENLTAKKKELESKAWLMQFGE